MEKRQAISPGKARRRGVQWIFYKTKEIYFVELIIQLSPRFNLFHGPAIRFYMGPNHINMRLRPITQWPEILYFLYHKK